MIQANELRIGNWVYYFGNDPVQVIRLTKGKQLLEQPIPLTPEILERCGFEKTGEIWEGTVPPSHLFQIKFLWKNKTPFIRAKFFDLNWHSGIQSIHQLQNLYFILSGEELKINLNVEAHQ